MALRLTEQVVGDAAGDKEQVLLPGDFVLNRRLRTVKLTKQGMKHALQYLRASLPCAKPMAGHQVQHALTFLVGKQLST